MCQGNWCVSGRREGGRWERGCAALGGDSCGVFVVSVDCSMLLRGVNASWIDRCCSAVGMVEPDESLLGVSHREEVNVSYCVGGGGGRGGGGFFLFFFFGVEWWPLANPTPSLGPFTIWLPALVCTPSFSLCSCFLRACLACLHGG